MRKLASRFQTVKGVGPCLTCVMLAYCPDIGEFTDGGIAKMCGDTLIDSESCSIKKKSKPKRSKANLRKAMYMAAISSSKSKHILRPIYLCIVARGKPRKVALTAFAHRIAILLNNIAKHPDFKPTQDPKDVAREAPPCVTADGLARRYKHPRTERPDQRHVSEVVSVRTLVRIPAFVVGW